MTRFNRVHVYTFYASCLYLYGPFYHACYPSCCPCLLQTLLFCSSLVCHACFSNVQYRGILYKHNMGKPFLVDLGTDGILHIGCNANLYDLVIHRHRDVVVHMYMVLVVLLDVVVEGSLLVDEVGNLGVKVGSHLAVKVDIDQVESQIAVVGIILVESLVTEVDIILVGISLEVDISQEEIVLEGAHNLVVLEVAHNLVVLGEAHNLVVLEEVHNLVVLEEVHNLIVLEEVHNLVVHMEVDLEILLEVVEHLDSLTEDILVALLTVDIVAINLDHLLGSLAYLLI